MLNIERTVLQGCRAAGNGSAGLPVIRLDERRSVALSVTMTAPEFWRVSMIEG